ncbi:hypothetical protein CGCA056_v015046 [Colletotrichum aenigma]|uniref:BTB domain-containing protein n=2 Tax=Colletotrichum fructicola (strain Nara gc5) TaxID=1213859 RepID=A0A7J6IVA7_COLFN|nr:uncharacterized protein CGCA056_v015175 [Colletotrichum aenigma]XP_037171211.1 uncharacterized protein CGCA056_v015161 [Colletotrichum aenigma]XP_037171222.1 uncharacterized protein CGCA056_v015147 [Colletotrichum aenigma]XP_037171229.1 uncharacterized protein CGCA056_v015140 [Colletotrichum aenigma]XP_037171266.1 uncharacterized protein CGCA056_v015104 [Colletotrichum aenigma]XP_037171297.1 uncharacterized protein CGCA056_v015073 [Colletotrichum aenigma]XP_037171325.1 uncharacterized prot
MVRLLYDFAKGAAAQKSRDTTQLIIIRCHSTTFLVHRDIIVECSSYFQGCIMGFYREGFDRSVDFSDDDDVRPECVYAYLSFVHHWYFAAWANGKPSGQGLMSIASRMTLSSVAEAIILSDRLLNRAMLILLKEVFIGLLQARQTAWLDAKATNRIWGDAEHQAYFNDYTSSFDVFSRGHADDRLMQEAIAHSWHIVTRQTMALHTHYEAKLSRDFVLRVGAKRHRPDGEDICTNMVERAAGVFLVESDRSVTEAFLRDRRRRRRVLGLFRSLEGLIKVQDLAPWYKEPPEAAEERSARFREGAAGMALVVWGGCF